MLFIKISCQWDIVLCESLYLHYLCFGNNFSLNQLGSQIFHEVDTVKRIAVLNWLAGDKAAK